MNLFATSHHGLMLTVVSVVFILCSAPHPTDAQRHRLCGNALRQSLQMLCLEYPSYHQRATRSESDVTDVDRDWPQLDQSDVDKFNFIEQLKRKPNWMNILFAKHRVSVDGDLDDNTEWENIIPNRFMPVKRGIVDECCYQSCTIEQMKAYCLKVARK
ncbi:insulin-2-like [Toxorhynchites rutilus septentrionalis]|uniref:insulin-2-like n=1 Tax=Toxorhynchites rutilus septentrionalis TaxID=329112 RepID=UPI0024790CE4|nr:insulin-2-like [Toxorhynchites rutilus septentrionalis]